MLQAVRAEGHVEDTAIFYIVGDNGGSAEGGFEGRDGVTVTNQTRPIEERLEHLDDLGSELFPTITPPPGDGRPTLRSNGPKRWLRISAALGIR